MTSYQNILLVEPYYGRSHRAFCDGLVEQSQWPIDLVSLPASLWKWRMRTGALALSQQVKKNYDLVICSDFVDVPQFLGFCRPLLGGAKVVTYFHENQLMYPVQESLERDLHFAVTNLLSFQISDQVWFNSEYHRSGFLTAADDLLRRLPETPKLRLKDGYDTKTKVLYPGIEPLHGRSLERTKERPGSLPTIAFNGRWEYDKNPQTFFQALFKLQEKGIPFRLRVMGESFSNVPPIFGEARERLKDRIDHFGYCSDRASYEDQLFQSDILVSTAIHEFFGIGVMEAIAHGLLPVLPKRLSYPELIPRHWHPCCLYENDDELADHLERIITGVIDIPRPDEISRHGLRFSWEVLGPQYDKAIAEILPTH